MAANVVTGRFQEDYPESYKKDAELQSEQEQSKALALTTGLLQREAARVALVAQSGPLVGLSRGQLDAEYDYVKWRLFGDAAGFDLYDAASEDHNEIFRDCVDEVSEAWFDRYADRFGRDPPVGLVEYSYPMMGVALEKRRHIEGVLEAEYERLRRERRQVDDAIFHSIPKGLFRRKKAAG